MQQVVYQTISAGITSGPCHPRHCGCQPQGGAGGEGQGPAKVEEVSPKDAKVRNINKLHLVVMMNH